MFSVIFPGQGSQIVGMGRELYSKYENIKKLFKKADDILDFPISNLILEGPKEKLDLTENTQPAIFLVGYSIFNLLKNEHSIDLNKAIYFAGHSLGEYTALSSAGGVSFAETLKILKIRGKSMQTSVNQGEGAMLAILGMGVDEVEQEISLLPQDQVCEISNDNSKFRDNRISHCIYHFSSIFNNSTMF